MGKSKINTDQQLFLEGLGEFKPTATHPTTSAAMSALIKSIRLRFTEDAIYWLHYLNTFPDQHYRICRRILLATGEDNLSIPVMHHASKFLSGCKNATLHDMATEVVRICKTKNWWEQDDGHQYIKFWRIVTSLPDPFKGCWFQDIRGELAEALAEENRIRSALALIRLKKFKHYNPKEFADWFTRQAEQLDSQEAVETLQVMLENPRAFKFDDNHLAQAHFRIFAGTLGEQDDPEIDPEEVQEFIDLAEARWKAPQPVPSFYLDGVHTSGKDKRFMGIPASMYGMCLAYKKFGRLHPDDVWPPDFLWRIEE